MKLLLCENGGCIGSIGIDIETTKTNKQKPIRENCYIFFSLFLHITLAPMNSNVRDLINKYVAVECVQLSSMLFGQIVNELIFALPHTPATAHKYGWKLGKKDGQCYSMLLNWVYRRIANSIHQKQQFCSHF